MSTLSAEPRGTAALLVNAQGQYLLHLRDANKPHICDPGTWSIPGGNREGDETAREAVARELKEETGLTVPLEPFTVVDSHGPDGRTAGRIQVYLGAWDGDADGLPLTEGIMLRWFDARTTAYLTMCPWTQQVIDQHQVQWAGTRTSATPPAEKPGGRACPMSSASISTWNTRAGSCSDSGIPTRPSGRRTTTSSPATASGSPRSPA
ncbi:NUDIX domain-containing protein [Streptomyces sp. MS1.HAVA.3]|uniref:NUDIX domain-containing protein n=1 Tax=Streptomyces caledonius TaxID=3134107 RepID=A0ABU8TZR2_9ACTN